MKIAGVNGFSYINNTNMPSEAKTDNIQVEINAEISNTKTDRYNNNNLTVI